MTESVHRALAPGAGAAPVARIVTFSTLFPNVIDPKHGVFVETRLRHLVQQGSVEARVIAPVPWFPSANPAFGRYARYATVPSHEERFGIPVEHPRYLTLPKVGMHVAPALLARAALPVFRRLRHDGFDFQAIDSHYLYPDGVAAAIIADALGCPFVMTARGTDVTLIPRSPPARHKILWAAERAAAIVTVCESLKRDLVALGVRGDKITPLRNGVDLDLFQPLDPAAARSELGLAAGTWLASVGHLIPRKGHELVIEALTDLPDVRLLIVGEGELRNSLEALARSKGVVDRVVFFGVASQAKLRSVYSAVDALVLASSREGWANVLLEAMACGTPVVATDVDGTSEVVQASEAGVLVRERSAAAIAARTRELLASKPDRAATRRYAEQFSWDDTTRGQLRIFSSITARAPAAGGTLRARSAEARTA